MTNQRRANPFSTRFVRPGALPYLFPRGETIECVVTRFASHDWRGQIIGPHGSGKSTLLHSLLPALRAAGRAPIVMTQRDGERHLSIDLERQELPDATGLVVIDGYEQLNWWTRYRLKRRCRRHRWGLLVTAHASQGLPTLFRTATSLALAVEIVRRLMPADAAAIPESVVARALSRRGGNLREALFDLYDVAEQPGRQGPTPAAP